MNPAIQQLIQQLSMQSQGGNGYGGYGGQPSYGGYPQSGGGAMSGMSPAYSPYGLPQPPTQQGSPWSGGGYGGGGYGGGYGGGWGRPQQSPWGGRHGQHPQSQQPMASSQTQTPSDGTSPTPATADSTTAASPSTSNRDTANQNANVGRDQYQQQRGYGNDLLMRGYGGFGGNPWRSGLQSGGRTF